MQRSNIFGAPRGRRSTWASLTAGLLAGAVGCSSGPSKIEPPKIDADAASAQAMELYDKNSDGAIAGEELEAAPALNASMETLDLNKDGKVQQGEIAERIQAWQSSGAGLSAITCTVTLNGRPLDGAEVTFDPEPFLGDAVKAAIGTTGAVGKTTPTIPKENRPQADMPPGIQYGLFRVRISKKSGGSETIPAKYNTETTLGQQVSADDPRMANNRVEFDLKTQ